MDEVLAKCQTVQYRILEEYKADIQNIVHNVVIYHGAHSAMADQARQMFRDCVYDITELTTCRDCYRYANTRYLKTFDDLSKDDIKIFSGETNIGSRSPVGLFTGSCMPSRKGFPTGQPRSWGTRTAMASWRLDSLVASTRELLSTNTTSRTSQQTFTAFRFVKHFNL